MTVKQQVQANTKLILIIFGLVIVSSVVLILYISNINPLSIIMPSSLEDNKEDIIYFNRIDINLLNSRFVSDVNEFVYCLYGDNYNKGIKVESIKETKVLSARNDEIFYMPCSKTPDFLGSIHSHPSGVCKLSERDIFTFGLSGNLLTGVVCGRDRVSIWDKNDLDAQYKTIIMEAE